MSPAHISDIHALAVPSDHVLVKGFHDSGSIQAVYGPFTRAHAEWLLRELLENSTYNWTIARLCEFREPKPEPPS